MTAAMQVRLSDQAADLQWGENALTSFTDGATLIHINDSDDHLGRIQQAGRRLDSQGIKQVQLSGAWDIEQQWAFAQGYMDAMGNNTLNWSDAEAADQAELDARLTVARWARDVINRPPEAIYPESLANEAASFIQQQGGDKVSVELIKGDELLAQQWVGTHAVGRASARPPVMLVLDYNPTGDANADVAAALVGKGITFDSGGYSLKPSAGMVSMKCDMGGAATVTAGLALAIRRGLNKRVKLILCCAENLVAGNAYKLGDVLTYKNGTTVEIVNTDAEGRLVLADGLMLAGETGAPLIIDAATLTGAAMVAVGSDYNALFALDKQLLMDAQAMAEQEHEPAWPLPLAPFHRNKCPSAFADTANSAPVKGGGFGGASNAAGFLSRFVPNDGKGWLHIDLASAYNASSDAKWSAGATALGMRTIAGLLLKG